MCLGTLKPFQSRSGGRVCWSGGGVGVEQSPRSKVSVTLVIGNPSWLWPIECRIVWSLYTHNKPPNLNMLQKLVDAGRWPDALHAHAYWHLNRVWQHYWVFDLIKLFLLTDRQTTLWPTWIGNVRALQPFLSPSGGVEWSGVEWRGVGVGWSGVESKVQSNDCY